jgi:Zn-dependent protease with chaperone function
MNASAFTFVFALALATMVGVRLWLAARQVRHVARHRERVPLGLPLLALVLWLMGAAGAWWWLYAWASWVGFNALVLVLYPTVIAPLFNKFEPLRRRRAGAAHRRAAGAHRLRQPGRVRDGRLAPLGHGNAYFTGLGRAKRIVFFDTLLQRLQPAEIEAVLAHELGHFKLRHIAKRLAFSFVSSLVFLALLGWLAGQSWFYAGLGVTPRSTARNERRGAGAVHAGAAGVHLRAGAARQPLSRRTSSRPTPSPSQHRGETSASALVKLYEDNAATLTPDPVHSAFYDSHPPAAIRIARLPVPKGAGDAKAGAAMHEKDCVACHIRRVGGDGSSIYTRGDRRVKSPAQLKAQVAVCNTELGTAYFPEEEEHIAAYLDLTYYKFKE